MTFAIRLCMGNSLWFSKCKNKVMNVEINFTYRLTRCSLCVLCVIWAQFVVAHFLIRRCSPCSFSTSNEGRRATPDDRVPQIALVSQRNEENCQKNTIFIKPRNFHIPFSLHGDRKEILVRENLKNIQLSAIFPCAGHPSSPSSLGLDKFCT